MKRHVNQFSQMVKDSEKYWSSNEQSDSNTIEVNIKNIMKCNDLICTTKEYQAAMKIARGYKAYLLRKAIYLRIAKRSHIPMLNK